MALAITIIFGAMELILLAYVIVSWTGMSPYHPIRQTLNSWVDPFIRPLRQYIPPMGMIDLSPLILFLILRLVRNLLIGLV